MNENQEIGGLLYKKRGGFGKIMPNAWQFRYFSVSKDGILSYYDTDSPEVVRGKLDLKGTYDLVLDLPIEGAPTNYCIQICPPNEERWRLCADTKEDHNRWSKVLERHVSERSSGGGQVNISCVSDDEVEKKERANSPGFRSKPNTPSNAKSGHQNFASFPPTPNAAAAAAAASSATAAPVPIVTPTPVSKPKAGAGGGKKRLKLGNKAEMISTDTCEAFLVLIIVNVAFYVLHSPSSVLRKITFVAIANLVVVRTLQLRAARGVPAAAAEPAPAAQPEVEKPRVSQPVTDRVGDVRAAIEATKSTPTAASATGSAVVPASRSTGSTGKPVPGFTFTEVHTEPRLSPPHTWCRVDHRQFNVRVGPDYNRYKKKAPSGAPLYEPFAVDVFCTKLRVDHAATRFQLPDTSHINTHNQFVPPILILQIQIPSEPPTSIFSSAEDGPGWAIVMYYKITEDTCNQLKDLSTASPAVKLFAEWCEKAPVDAAWRGRFKVINSCTNLEELGMPSAIVSYNAKPVLIRRTGTIFRGSNYLEMNIHVHKFANLAKQSIYLISSRCGLMFMQIGFVIEGREDKELPETMFACVAVNKPQEDQAEFIFDDDEA